MGINFTMRGFSEKEKKRKLIEEIEVTGRNVELDVDIEYEYCGSIITLHYKEIEGDLCEVSEL